MAVTYSITGENTIVIGGQSTLTSPQVGVVGPFPRYNISREVLRKDSLYMGEKYNITISGTALIEDSASMLVAGQRQNEIHQIIARILTLDAKKGTLEIAPYGGQTSIIKFTDAILISADSPEQDADQLPRAKGDGAVGGRDVSMRSARRTRACGVPRSRACARDGERHARLPAVDR